MCDKSDGRRTQGDVGQRPSKRFATPTSGAVPLRLQPDTVDVWWVPIQASPTSVRTLLATLSDAERRQADRYRFPELTRNYIIVHGVLRVALGSYLRMAPGAVSFMHGDNGKPYLSRSQLRFNVSDSCGVSMMGFTSGADIGVDVERVRELSDWPQIAKQFFCAEEYDQLDDLPVPLQRNAFFDCWTKKEAYLKATGEGLLVPLNSFCVRIRAAMSFVSDTTAGREWSMFEASPDPRYAAAVVIEAGEWTLRCLRFENVEQVLAFASDR
jgi:4'-phosphopantetheinyl transferase